MLPRNIWAAEKDVYVVGSTATGVPFTFLDVKTNTLTGAMVDIINAVANDAGFRVDLQVVAFSALIPSLTTGKIDIIATAMVKTPEREKVVDFSLSVLPYSAGLVVPSSDKTDYRSIADLKSKTVGAQVGTKYPAQLQSAGAKEVKTYDSLSDILRDLHFGRIEACYGDAPILAYQMNQTKDPNVRFVSSFTPPSVDDVCLIVRKGETELLGRINKSIQRIKTTTIKSILERWHVG
jgi:polar amino acid transport system substrate-binding protein